jgi:tryptophanyl-tRNA synthetase
VKKLGKDGAKAFETARKAFQQDGSDDALTRARALVEGSGALSAMDRERLDGYLRGTGKSILHEPQALHTEVKKLPGLDGAKMSKSYGNAIDIFEEEKALRKKIMGIQTDSTPVEAPKPTENSAILALYKLVASAAEYDAMVAAFQAGGSGYGDFKKTLFAAVWNYFAPMREKRAAVVADPKLVDDVLRDGAAKANAIADGVMKRVRKAVGLI